MKVELSDNARIVLGSSFGWGQVLTYHMIQSVPSPEMQEALDELVNAGLLRRDAGLPDMTKKAIRYKLAEGVDIALFRKLAAERFFSGDAPAIRVFVPKETTNEG
jgi:hypothetical protein